MLSAVFATSDGGKGGASAVDRSVLGEWLDGDDDAIDALLIVFRNSIRDELSRIRELLAAGNLAECAKAAHRLRGAAMSMGANAVAAAAGTLDNAAAANNAENCAGIMPELETRVVTMEAEVPDRA